MNKSLPAILIVALVCVLQFAHAADVRPWKQGDPLLKPAPTDHSPFLPRAEEVARAKFPELFEGKFTGTIALYVDLDIEGKVLSVDTLQFPAGSITEQSLSREQRDAMMEIVLHDVYRQAGSQGSKFFGWFGPKRANGLYLYYRVLKWRLNPLRTAARVRSAVAERYPEFHKPRLLQRNQVESRDSLLTVVMKDEGSIDGAILVENASEEDLSDRKMFDRFLQLGLKPEQLAYRGRTTNQGDFQDKNLTAPLLVIQYAWRRTNDDPQDEILGTSDVLERTSLLHLREQQSHPPDAEFLKRYFPAVWRNGLTKDDAGIWLLLARSGQVIDGGMTKEDDFGAVEKEIQERHVGVKTAEGASSSVEAQSGSMVTMHYAWIASDSQVIPRPRVGSN